MSYQAEPSPIAKKVLGVIVALLVAAVVRFGVQSAIEAYHQYGTDWSAKFDADVAGNPVMKPLFGSFRNAYPEDYGRFKAEAIAQAKAGASAQSLRTFGANWMRTFMQSHVRDVAQAPHLQLAAFREAQLGLARALRDSSPAQCGHFMMTGLDAQDDVEPYVLPLLAKVGQAQVEAAVAGSRSPAGRVVSDLSKADNVALFQGMQRAGVSNADISLITSENGLANANVEKQCQLGLDIAETVASLPDPQADRVSAYLLTHS